jgi:hypothetical protein
MAQKFYRKGKDIHEAGTNRYIGSTEWEKKWTGRATEVDAPVEEVQQDPLPEKSIGPELNSDPPVILDDPSTERSLPGSGSLGSDSSFANLRSLLAKTTRLAAAEGPSAEDYLGMYKQKGIDLDPNTMASALNRGTISRAGMVKDVYQSSLDLINEQETRQKDYLNNVMSGLPKSFLSQMSGKDYDEIRSGNVSPELKERIAAAILTDDSTGAGKWQKLDDKTLYNTTSGETKSVGVTKDPEGISPVSGWHGDEVKLGTGGECGTFSRGLTDITAPMGDTFKSKSDWIDNNNGVKGLAGVGVGDIVITDGSDVSASGDPLGTGHALIVGAMDPDGNIYAYESNAKGNGEITFGRWVNPSAAYGYISGSEFGAMKPEEFKKMQAVAMEYGVKGKPEIDSNLSEDGYDISRFTPEFYDSDFGQKVINNEQQEKSNFMGQQAVKDFISVQNKAGSMQKIIDLGVGGPADLALVFEFMKALDPTSVVRESEYESASKSGNIFKGIYAKFNGYLKAEGGFLPDNVKDAFVAITMQKLDINKKTYEQIRSQYRKIGYEQGLNPDHVAPNLSIDISGDLFGGANDKDLQYLKDIGAIK